MSVEMAKLRTGALVPAVVVSTVTLVVRGWLDDGVGGALLFYDAVSLARDPSYKPFGSNSRALAEAGFADPDGRLQDTVRSILLACSEGEGLSLAYAHPLGGAL